MDTLKELEYYCKTPNPVGALMLTGEWGCGKTYLIKHQLKESLKDTHTIVIVSLFGLSTAEEIRDAVKNAYWEALLLAKGTGGKILKGFQDNKDKFKGLTDWLPLGKKVADTVLAINPKDLVKVENKIDKKDAVLVFDDLERSKLDPIELLGVINDYCENLNFHTIIVSNEDKMTAKSTDDSFRCSQLLFDGKMLGGLQNRSGGQKDQPVQIKTYIGLSRQQDEGLTYDEIKEKIVQRTIAYTPNYEEIIASIIDSFACKETQSGYKKLLTENSDSLQILFQIGQTDRAEKKTQETASTQQNSNHDSETPHNLRSFRCAIQDFERIFILMKEHNIENLDKWLYSFMMFEMGVRTGNISEGFSQNSDVKDLYPEFNSQYILEFEREWILKGEWNDSIAEQDIKEYLNRQKANTPYDMVRLNDLGFLEDQDVVAGFPLVLAAGYEGKLELDEYITLIRNIKFVRTYIKELYEQVEIEKLKTGIENKLQLMMDSGEQDKFDRQFISAESLKTYSDDEKELYYIISKFRETDSLVYASNKKAYIDTMKVDCMTSLGMLRSRRFDGFDEDMAKATAEAYIDCNNAGKYVFASNCRGAWKYWGSSEEMNNSKTLRGLQQLYDDISTASKAVECTQSIQIWHFNAFMKDIQTVLSELKKENFKTE